MSQATAPEIMIRKETAADHVAVFTLIEEAFRTEEFSDHQEQFLVERLRNSAAFIPELSLVAEKQGEVVGHILLTRIEIIEGDAFHASLALAPVSVHPDHQGQGIGTMLIEQAHLAAREQGHDSIVLLGHAEYYPRFGYVPAHNFDIRLPFEAPPENCMVLELQPGALTGVSGLVKYATAFFE